MQKIRLSSQHGTEGARRARGVGRNSDCIVLNSLICVTVQVQLDGVQQPYCNQIIGIQETWRWCNVSRTGVRNSMMVLPSSPRSAMLWHPSLACSRQLASGRIAQHSESKYHGPFLLYTPLLYIILSFVDIFYYVLHVFNHNFAHPGALGTLKSLKMVVKV